MVFHITTPGWLFCVAFLLSTNLYNFHAAGKVSLDTNCLQLSSLFSSAFQLTFDFFYLSKIQFSCFVGFENSMKTSLLDWFKCVGVNGFTFTVKSFWESFQFPFPDLRLCMRKESGRGLRLKDCYYHKIEITNCELENPPNSFMMS